MRKRQPRRSRFTVLAATLLGWAGAQVAPGAVLHVAPSGADAHDGRTWPTARKTVQSALNSAVGGDEVWVAAGTYVECITLKPGVALYGGFAGTEPRLDQRDWAVNVTILDGNKSGSVVTAPSGATSTTRIDGFTIRNGTGTPSGSYRYGGGIYCNASSPTIANNVMTGNSGNSNSSGGAIYCKASSALILGNTLRANTGGAIACYDCPSLTIADNIIEANVGNGIYCSTASPVILRNRINENTAYRGSGISCDMSSSPLIQNNVLFGNRQNDDGGTGGAIYCSASSPIVLSNVLVANTADAGGGVYCIANSAPLIVNNTIAANTSSDFGGGGGICSSASSPVIANNAIAYNSSGVRCSGGAPVLRTNCVYHLTGYDYAGVVPGADDIAADPRLVDVEFGQVQLMAGSPCIDAGDDSVATAGAADIDGDARVLGRHVDIGADEFTGTSPAFTRKTIRVAISGNDANDGTTWPQAMRTVQAAINVAHAAGGAELWVASGVYAERIRVKRFVHLYGGFAGTEQTLAERDWLQNGTVLDGGAAGTVVTVEQASSISTLDGFTVRNGKNSSGAGVNFHSCLPRILHSTIAGNAGPGLSHYKASPIIAGNTISGNSAAGVRSLSGHSAILNNRIVGNQATSGGGIYCAGSDIIAHNTIVGNTGTTGAGLYLYYSSTLVCGNIVAFNASGIAQANGTPVLRNNCVYNPGGSEYTGLNAGVGDISVDPQFVDASAGDHHLRPLSPCIDSGYNAPLLLRVVTDYDGHVRAVDDPATSDCPFAPGKCGTAPIVDMGAFEFIPKIPGDFDRDGDVDTIDLAEFIACAAGPNLAVAADCRKADLDGDGDADQSDFGVLQVCCSGPLHPADAGCARGGQP